VEYPLAKIKKKNHGVVAGTAVLLLSETVRKWSITARRGRSRSGNSSGKKLSKRQRASKASRKAAKATHLKRYALQCKSSYALRKQKFCLNVGFWLLLTDGSLSYASPCAIPRQKIYHMHKMRALLSRPTATKALCRLSVATLAEVTSHVAHPLLFLSGGLQVLGRVAVGGCQTQGNFIEGF